MNQVLCSNSRGSSKWKSWKDPSLLPVCFPGAEVQGLQQTWSFLIQQVSLHHPVHLISYKVQGASADPKDEGKKSIQGKISLVRE